MPYCNHSPRKPGCALCGIAAAKGIPEGVSVTPSRAAGRPPPAPPATAPARRRVCLHEGPVLEWAPCGSELRHVRDCDVHDRCTRGPGRLATCRTCPDYRTDWPLHFDESNLAPGVEGRRFNASLMAHGDGYLLAWRSGWAGSEIWVSVLDRDLRPAGTHSRLDLTRPASAYGREDPVLFRFRGRPHVAFVGVQGSGRYILRTQMLYARLTEDGLHAEEVFPLEWGPPGRWQKNWSPFEHDGSLYAVYSINPHLVVRIDGPAVTPAHETAWSPGWVGGEMRGGAAPVLAGGEFWHFFHDRVTHPDGMQQYRTGLYCCEARPPFRPTRIIREPVLAADPGNNPGNYCHCLFVRGAVLLGGHWLLSHGVHDRVTEVHRLPHAGLESRLTPA